MASVGFAVAIHALFVVKMPWFESRLYSPEEFEHMLPFNLDSNMLRSLSAVATGLLFAKVLGYFKVLNKYLATFVFALGVVSVSSTAPFFRRLFSSLSKC